MRNSIIEIDDIKEDKRRKALCICIVVFIAGFLIYILASFRIKDITVIGSKHYSDNEITDIILDSSYKEHTVCLWLYEKIGRHKDIPFIDHYEINIKDIKTAEIIIYEKDIYGCFEQMGTYMFFNKDGILLECSSTRVEGVPVITGVPYKNAVMNEKIETEKQDIFDKIHKLVQNLDKNGIEAGRIHFDTDYAPVIYIGNIKVMLGDNTDIDGQMNELKNILPKLEGLSGTLNLSYFSVDKKDISYPFVPD